MSTHDSPSGSTTAEEQVEEHWVDGGDYSFRISGDTIIARNAKGRVLKTVPPKAKKTETYEKLESLRSYLHQHDVSVLTRYVSGFERTPCTCHCYRCSVD